MLCGSYVAVNDGDVGTVFASRIYVWKWRGSGGGEAEAGAGQREDLLEGASGRACEGWQRRWCE